MVVNSLRECPSGDVARSQLAAAGFGQLVEEFAAANLANLLEATQIGKFKVAIVNSPEIMHYPALATVSDEASRALIDAASNPIARRHFPLGGIWAGYADALARFLNGCSRTMEVPKPRGFEKFIVPYIHYMCAPDEVERARWRLGILASFARRNRDRRLRDWVGFDGDGERPVKWDFRLYALERARPLESAYGNG